MLTIGIITAAMADAQSKVQPENARGSEYMLSVILGKSNLFDIHFLARSRALSRPLYPIYCSAPLRNNGSLRPAHVRQIRFPLAGKPLLQPRLIPPTFPALLLLTPIPAQNTTPIASRHRLATNLPRKTQPRRFNNQFSPLTNPPLANQTIDPISPSPPLNKCNHAICLHPRREPPRL